MTNRRLVFTVILLAALLLAATGPIGADSTVYLPLAMKAYPHGWLEVGVGSASGGGISDNAGRSEEPAIAFGSGGAPFIAWSDDSSGNYEIYVRRWNGSRWVEVGEGSATGGGISDTSDNSQRPSMAASPDGSVYVTWEEWMYDSFPMVYAKRWNGSSWAEVGAGSASGTGLSSGKFSRAPSVAVSPTGISYVAWSVQADHGTEIYILRWTGSSWQEVGAGSASGGGISNVGSSVRPAVAVAPDGTPYVAWEYTAGFDQIYVRRFNGAAWEEAGAGSASGTGISNTPFHSNLPALAIDSNGVPYVCWDDNSHGADEIYVRRFSSASWQEVGTGSASGGGISENQGNSVSCTIAVAPDGALYVTWADESNGNDEIYVRTWDGLSWSEVGVGSANGGGISNTSNASWHPTVAVSPVGVPYVAWYEFDDGGGNHEIYVRRYQ